MGTGAGPSFGGTKGNKSSKLPSIMDNVRNMTSIYPIREGLFGTRSKKGRQARLIKSQDPLKTVHDFYDRITKGLTSSPLPNGKGKKAKTSDGYTITIREVSSSDGSPAIDIRKPTKPNPGDVKVQKIHFVKED